MSPMARSFLWLWLHTRTSRLDSRHSAGPTPRQTAQEYLFVSDYALTRFQLSLQARLVTKRASSKLPDLLVDFITITTADIFYFDENAWWNVQHEHESHCSVLEEYEIKGSGLKGIRSSGKKKIKGKARTWFWSFKKGKEKGREAGSWQGNATSIWTTASDKSLIAEARGMQTCWKKK